MKPILRSLLAAVAVLGLAAILAWGFIQRQDRTARSNATKNLESSRQNRLALRLVAVDAAKKDYQVSLEAERIAFEQEKRESDFEEIAILSHEVRLLRIELEYKTALAAIDKRYPPPDATSLERPPAP